jgi:hypothetical protein
MKVPDRASDSNRVPTISPASPFPEGSTRNTKVFTAAEKRDEDDRKRYNMYMPDAIESAEIHSRAHAEESAKNG